MKYDIIAELKAKKLIEALDFEQQNALRKMIKGIDHGPNSVEVDKDKTYGLISCEDHVTSLMISNRGRELRRGSNPKEKTKCDVLVELLPAGLCTFTVTKYDETGFRIMRFRTSTKKSHVFNQLELKYYDSEATSCCGKNSLQEPTEKLLEFAGIIPDEEEVIQLPDGIKGSEEIIEYINIALSNPDTSYTEVANALAERKRIGKSEDSENVIFVNISGDIVINRNNSILVKKFVQ